MCHRSLNPILNSVSFYLNMSLMWHSTCWQCVCQGVLIIVFIWYYGTCNLIAMIIKNLTNCGRRCQQSFWCKKYAWIIKYKYFCGCRIFIQKFKLVFALFLTTNQNLTLDFDSNKGRAFIPTTGIIQTRNTKTSSKPNLNPFNQRCPKLNSNPNKHFFTT